MANRYWVNGTGTWDNVDTTHRSATSNGAGGQSVPGVSDAVILDASSCAGGESITVNTNFSVVSVTMGAFTGTLDFSVNNNSPTMGTFSNSGAGTRTLKLGSGTFYITNTGANTVVNFQTTTGLTFDAGTSTIDLSGNATVSIRTIVGGGDSFPFNNLKISAGSTQVTINATSCNNLDFTGFTGIGDSTTGVGITIAGNLICGAGMTWNSDTGALTFIATSPKTITMNGVKINRPITFNGVGGTWTLQDDLDMSGASLRALAVTNGTLDANDHNVKCGSSSNTGTITMGSGTWEYVGTGNVWTCAGTVNSETSTIKITNTSDTALSFLGNGKTYNNIWFSRGASTASNTITGSSTFNDFKDDGTAAHSIIFTHGTTTGFTTWNINGADASNLITITSDTAATFTLKNNGTAPVFAQYLNISKSVAT